MRKLLNVLYITTPEAFLSKDGENVVVRIENEERLRVPIHNLEGIVYFGYPGVSPALLGHCAERSVAVTFLTEHGEFLAKLVGPVSGNVLLRREQYRAADREADAVTVASAIIAAKIINSRSVLQRAMRDHGDVVNTAKMEKAVDKLADHIRLLEQCHTLDTVRGVEGEAAHIYFSVFDDLILVQKDAFFMRTRNRRPPLDNMNALLSFLYTLLRHDVEAALQTVGLDSAVGFLHRDRPGRASLALDMMEELRPHLADRLALSLVNRRQLDARCFHHKESGGVFLEGEARKEVLSAWQKRKQEEIIHPYLGEKMPIGLIPYVQAMLLARYLRGDIDGYPPFFWK